MRKYYFKVGFILVSIILIIAFASTRRKHLFPIISLVKIPAGEFMMGSKRTEVGREDDETLHRVKITYSFWIGSTEITQRQWYDVMGTTINDQRRKRRNYIFPLVFRIKGYINGVIMNPGNIITTIKRLKNAYELAPPRGEGDEYPMYSVSYGDAELFCERMTERGGAMGLVPIGYEYRLPTEAEWEYACRAGSTSRFANGETEADLAIIGWYSHNAEGTSHPVGNKLPNAWGLYDMHGNVWEWCYDMYWDYSSSDDVVDPLGSTFKFDQVFRGGDFNAAPVHCRSAVRNFENDDLSWLELEMGFRIVLAPTIDSIRGHTTLLTEVEEEKPPAGERSAPPFQATD
jgi:formylglycine-generating enzyme required for sulfatase activity